MNLIEILEQDLEIESKATEGKWRLKLYNNLISSGHLVFDSLNISLPLGNIKACNDANFIAHSRNTYRSRIEALKIAVEALERLQFHPWKPEEEALAKIKALLEETE